MASLRQLAMRYFAMAMEVERWAGYGGYVSNGKCRSEDGTALGAIWSLGEYLRWQREQDERDEKAREQVSIRVLAEYDPECEAAVRALEEGGWRCQADLENKR